MSARPVCASCGWTGTTTSPARAAAMGAKHVCKTADGVRRATRRYRCGRCGLESVYENAGATEARYWFSRHSCRKREYAMLRTAAAEALEAMIDRTPKPCHHKIAAHQHGTRACYVLDTCRCPPCASANAAAEGERTRLKAYGRYHKYVPAEFVRDHLATLKAYGIGLKTVSKLSGVSNGSLTKIVYGTYAPSTGPSKGCKGNGELLRGPARRVLRSTAEAIYAVEAVPANLGPRQPDHQRTAAARRHLRALVALGWSMSKLGDRLGILPSNMTPVVSGDRVLARGTVDRIEALYAELSMTLPPRGDHRSKIAASRARRYAADRGWLPPLALDDDEDTPVGHEETGDVDEVAIQRRINGDKTIRLTKVEAAALVARWDRAGRTRNECERVTGINPRRYGTTGVAS